MAAIQLDLTTDWVLLTENGFTGSCGATTGGVEIINAVSAPTGYQAGAVGYSSADSLYLPKPLSDSLYIRTTNGTGFVSGYEVG